MDAAQTASTEAKEATVKQRVTQPMIAWAEYADGTREEQVCADGPATCRWMCEAQAAGATTTGYSPVPETGGGCTYHVVECVAPMKFRVEVYRDGWFVDVDPDTGECTHTGGRKVATLFRRSEQLAIGAGIAYSFDPPRAGAAGKGRLAA